MPASTDHVRVGVRIKPTPGPSSCEGDAAHNKVLLARSAHGAARRYTFDHVFEPSATNAELYASVGAPLLNAALDGYNATLLAYGQTGAGKTHTIMGQGQDPGVVMRLVAQLFDAAGKQGKHVQFSMLEIYNERIRDLFSVRRSCADSLRIREDPATGPFVEDLSWFVAEDQQAMQQLLSIGAEARTVRSTHNNQHSSRAHTVVQIAITSLGAGSQPGNEASSMICVVDLAGSERHDASGPQSTIASKTMREGCSINQSLTNLGLCISALVAAGPGNARMRGGQSPRRLAALGLSPGARRGGAGSGAIKSHIPYRNSALTWLLRESIGGNSKTAILCCINPEPRHREESLSTLRFADRAKQLTTRVDRNGNSMHSGGARRGGVLRELPLSGDAQATIDALREELQTLKSTLEAHGTAGGPGPCLIPGGLITAVNGRKVEPSRVTFRNGDRVTVWDPASQQEHAFLHLESTAPKQTQKPTANQQQDERVEMAEQIEQIEQEQEQEDVAEAERLAADAGLDESMVSFLEMEEMAYAHRPRRHSLDSTIANQTVGAEEISDRFVATESPRATEAEVERMQQSQERKKQRLQRRHGRSALKTSTSTVQDEAHAGEMAQRGDGLALGGGWAPVVVFVLGCGAAVLLPSGEQLEEPSAQPTQEHEEARASAVGGSVDVGDSWKSPAPVDMSPAAVAVARVGLLLARTPTVVGVIGWLSVAYVLLRRWRVRQGSKARPGTLTSTADCGSDLGQRQVEAHRGGEKGEEEAFRRRRRRKERDRQQQEVAVIADADANAAFVRDDERRRRRQRAEPRSTNQPPHPRAVAVLGDITNEAPAALHVRSDGKTRRHGSSLRPRPSVKAHGEKEEEQEQRRRQHRREQRERSTDGGSDDRSTDQRHHRERERQPRHHDDERRRRQREDRHRQQRERPHHTVDEGGREAWREQCSDALAV